MADTLQQARTCVLVLGMHRSGTSALARVIGLLGAALPRDPNNEAIGAVTDHWEPLPVVELNDAILAAAGSRWNDWRAFRPDDAGPAAIARAGSEIARVLQEQFGDAPLFVLKDPRIDRLLPLYRSALVGMQVAPRYVLSLRNPLAVATSLHARDGTTRGFAELLWLRQVLDAERATRGGPRVIVSYERLIAGWRAVATELAEGLGLAWPTPPDAAASAVDAFLDPSKRHHVIGDAELDRDPEVSAWVRDAYAAMRRLEPCPGDASALATLDRVSLEFDRVAPVFGAACFPELAWHEQRFAEGLGAARAESEALRTERDALKSQCEALRSERDSLRLHADAERSERLAAQARWRSVAAELDRIRGTWWRRVAERIDALARKARRR